MDNCSKKDGHGVLTSTPGLMETASRPRARLWRLFKARTTTVGGVLEVAKRFMVRWHEQEARGRRKRHASSTRGVQGEDGGQQWGNRGERKQEGDGRKSSKASRRPYSTNKELV